MLKKKTSLNSSEVSQCQDNMVAFSNAIKCLSWQVRWFKIFTQTGKEMRDLLPAICIREASSAPVPQLVGCLDTSRPSPCEGSEGSARAALPGAVPSPTAGASPPDLGSMRRWCFFKAFVLITAEEVWGFVFKSLVVNLFIKALSSFLEKVYSVEPPLRKLDSGRAWRGHCPFKDRQPTAKSYLPLLWCPFLHFGQSLNLGQREQATKLARTFLD